MDLVALRRKTWIDDCETGDTGPVGHRPFLHVCMGTNPGTHKHPVLGELSTYVRGARDKGGCLLHLVVLIDAGGEPFVTTADDARGGAPGRSATRHTVQLWRQSYTTDGVAGP